MSLNTASLKSLPMLINRMSAPYKENVYSFLSLNMIQSWDFIYGFLTKFKSFIIQLTEGRVLPVFYQWSFKTYNRKSSSIRRLFDQNNEILTNSKML